MHEQVPFINREKELALIKQLIGEWGKQHILCIDGPGGIGKTRLLHEVRERLLSESADHLHVLDIVDFDDPAFQTLEPVMKKIAEQFDGQYFTNYLSHLDELFKMREVGFRQAEIKRKEQKTNSSFIKDFNDASDKKRVIWFIDTTDALIDKTSWWKDLHSTGVLAKLKNYFFLIAGRDARKIGENILKPLVSQFVDIIDLKPLNKKVSASYLQQKIERLNIALEEDLAQRLLLLAAGRPIILDLAAEWRTRGISLSWLTQEPLELLQRLSEEWQKEESDWTKESKARREEFEKQLVIHLAQTRNEMDWLILLMARIYPLDRDMTAALLNISIGEADSLFEEAQDYVFVKSLPDGQIKLHDEMERMVYNYVWPEVDADGDYHREYSRLSIEYLQKHIEKKEGELQKIGEKLAAAQTSSGREALALRLQVSSLKRNILNLKKKKLDFLLSIRSGEANDAFADLFDAAGKAYNLQFRNGIIEQIKKYYLTEENLKINHIVSIRYVIHLMNNSKYEDAKRFAKFFLEQEGISPAIKIEMLIKLANIKIRLGEYQQGVSCFEKAIDMARENNLTRLEFSALNGLGYNYRLIGDIDQARRTYREAHRLSLKSGSTIIEKDQLASLLNNMGYVYALKRDRDSALRLCRDAEKLWYEDGRKRGVGIVNSTWGTIHIEFDEHDEALKYFDIALSVLSDVDTDYRSMVYLGQATVFCLQGKTDKAEERLGNVEELDIERDKPEYFYIKGNVLLKKGLIDEASKAFEQGHDFSEKAHNVLYKLSCLAELAKITVLLCAADPQRIPSQLNNLTEDIKKITSNENENKHDLQIALLRRCAGDLSLLDNNLRQAIKFYREAFPSIAKKGRYEPYTITGQLLDIQKNVLPHIDVETVRKLAQQLRTFWIDEEHDIQYPEALNNFGYWQSGDINTWGE